MPRIQDIGAFSSVREAGLAKLLPSVPRIAIGMGTCGRGNGAEGLFHALAEQIHSSGISVVLAPVGCFGACFQEPMLNVRLPGGPLLMLRSVQANDAARILQEVSNDKISPELLVCKIEEWDHITGRVKYGQGHPEVPTWDQTPFFRKQKKIVLRNCGLINPDDIEEYIAVGGYQALYKVLIDGHPESVIDVVKASRLRGRGGAGHCELQAMASAMGLETVGFAYNYPQLPVDLSHPRFILDHNRCILCTRCVRVCAELEGAQVWELTSRGNHARIVSDMNDKWAQAASCTTCGKCVHACPTGALAEKGWAVEKMVKKVDTVTSLLHKRGVLA